MPTNLPPMAAIRAFEAAARRASFTRAAEELGMTQAAVSYQIKVLEDRVGAALFLRQPRGVALTDVGLRLSRQASEALDLLRDAFAEAKGQTEGTLVLSVVPTFATNILAQRLGRFQIDNPDIAVRVDISQSLVDFARENVDLAIRAGAGDWPGVASQLLLRGVFTPMLSPQLAARIGGVNEPSDLLKLPILEPADPWWSHWFEAAGVPAAKLKRGPGLQTGSQVLEGNAAIAGQGVGILTPAFYRDDIDQGRLYQPFELTCDDGLAYWLVYPESRRNAPKIKAFRDWITGEMAKTG
jgi:LysR family glycine cleavage system transcriptional activator